MILTMHTLQVTRQAFLLDHLLKHCADLKKTKIKQILKYGSVRVNGRVVTLHRHELKPGDTIDFLSQKEALAERLKTGLDFSVIYEDSDLIVVDKPTGLLTMGTEHEKEDTVYFKLTEYLRTKSDDGHGRVFIVHRLDRDSSGLVVFAKNEATKHALQKNWAQTVKKYYAVTEGVPEEKEGRMESHLEEDKFRRVYRVNKESRKSRRAVTHYRLLRENGRYALLDVTLETGRKNQIRVHLSDLGHPITGDMKYGAQSNPIKRLALHAYHLSLPHPKTGEIKTFTSKLPEPFEKILKSQVA